MLVNKQASVVPNSTDPKSLMIWIPVSSCVMVGFVSVISWPYGDILIGASDLRDEPDSATKAPGINIDTYRPSPRAKTIVRQAVNVLSFMISVFSIRYGMLDPEVKDIWTSE